MIVKYLFFFWLILLCKLVFKYLSFLRGVLFLLFEVFVSGNYELFVGCKKFVCVSFDDVKDVVSILLDNCVMLLFFVSFLEVGC